MTGREIVGYAVSGTQADPIPESRTGVPVDRVAKARCVALAACRHCADQLAIIQVGTPWVHRTTGIRSCLQDRMKPEWERALVADEDVPLPAEAVEEQEGDREMLGFGKNKDRHSNGFAMGPGTGPVMTPKQRVERAQKLRAQGRGTKRGRKGGK